MMVSMPEISDYLQKLLDRTQAGATQVVEGVVTTTDETFRLFNGEYYELFELFEGVKDGETVRVLLANLDNTPEDTVTDVINFSIQTVGKINVTTTFNPTVSVQGTELNPRNKDTKIDANLENTEVYRGGTYTGGEDPLTYTAPGGRGEVELGTVFTTEATLIADGDSLLVEIFNDAGRTIDVSIQTEFVEVERL